MNILQDIDLVLEEMSDYEFELDKTCKASRFIEVLQKLINEHGDLPIYSDDPDTQDLLPLGLIYAPEEKNFRGDYPERFEIKTTYGIDLEGRINNE